MHTRSLTLVVWMLLASGCQQGPPPEPPAGPPAEDLSYWSIPALVQPDAMKAGAQGRSPARPPPQRKSMSMCLVGSIK